VSIYINNNVKETDDDSLVDGLDAGAVPATSTKHETWADKPARWLGEYDVHGGRVMPDWYYYTQQEWSRLGLGLLPPERKRPDMGVKQDRQTAEDVSEDSDTKI